MGIEYFFTYVDKNLFSKWRHQRTVNLINESVIIDGFSFLYFLNKKAAKDVNNNTDGHHQTEIRFGPDDGRKIFFEVLKRFKDKCAQVYVVFDGRFEPNKHKRPRSSEFSDNNVKQTFLVTDEIFSDLLSDLKISSHAAEGEADPAIVRMAREKNAYVVADDSDYHLYNFDRGYVPLSYLSLDNLEGKVYVMNDVFPDLNQEGVALWATTMTFDFIKFDNLDELLMRTEISPEQVDYFQITYLDSENLTPEVCQSLTRLWKLHHFIRMKGKEEVYNELIKLVPVKDRLSFDRMNQNFIDAPIETLTLRRNNNSIPSHLLSLYKKNRHGRMLIDILVEENVLPREKGTHLAHLRLLLPMCHILLQRDYQKKEATNHNPTTTFQGQEYHPSKFVQPENLPSLTETPNLEKKRRKGFVLGSVDFALKRQTGINWRGIQNNYLPWLSLLTLWFHTSEASTPLRERILFAMIISYIKHVLLDTDKETEAYKSIDKQKPSKPLLQYSTEHLKLRCSLCYWEHPQTNSEQCVTDRSLCDTIKKEFSEVQEFYKELKKVNQFADEPFEMPFTHYCVSELTLRLAVAFQTSPIVLMDSYFGNEVLDELTKEIFELIQSSFE